MRFKITVAHKDNLGNFWDEEYDKNIDDPKKWAEETIENFNNTLYPGEKARVLLDVIIEDPNTRKEHEWEKTNIVTIIKRGQLYDIYRCVKCGITAKRYGLGDIKIDSKFKAKVYQRCDTSYAHRKKKGLV